MPGSPYLQQEDASYAWVGASKVDAFREDMDGELDTRYKLQQYDAKDENEPFGRGVYLHTNLVGMLADSVYFCVRVCLCVCV